MKTLTIFLCEGGSVWTDVRAAHRRELDWTGGNASLITSWRGTFGAMVLYLSVVFCLSLTGTVDVSRKAAFWRCEDCIGTRPLHEWSSALTFLCESFSQHSRVFHAFLCEWVALFFARSFSQRF